jgi:hypothetical protein
MQEVLEELLDVAEPDVVVRVPEVVMVGLTEVVWLTDAVVVLELELVLEVYGPAEVDEVVDEPTSGRLLTLVVELDDQLVVLSSG